MKTVPATIEEIKQAFIHSCLTFNPAYFKPYLNSDKFICDGEKKGFYRSSKMMLSNSRAQTDGDLSLRIENVNYGGRNIQQYCIYDAVHKYARLSVNMEESEESVYIELLPF